MVLCQEFEIVGKIILLDLDFGFLSTEFMSGVDLNYFHAISK